VENFSNRDWTGKIRLKGFDKFGFTRKCRQIVLSRAPTEPAELETVVPRQEQPVSPFMSGTRHIRVGYPNGLPNWISTGIPKNPTVIDRAWETRRSTTFKIKKSRSLPCPQGENRRARANGFDWQRQFVTMRAW
jgi:hypothetical protein